MKKSRSGPSSPENIRRMVSGSMTVKVAEASIDMLTPPCSPNSWRALASASAGSSAWEGTLAIEWCFLAAAIWSHWSSEPERFLLDMLAMLELKVASAIVGVWVRLREKRDFDCVGIM